MPASNDFAERFRATMAARKTEGITGASVASELDVTPSTVSGWQSGRIEPSREKLPQLAEFLGVDLVWLAFGDEAVAKYQAGRKVMYQAKSSAPRVVREGGRAESVTEVVHEGQRWAANYAARLLEAAAEDARAMANVEFELPPDVPHDNNDAERDRLNAALSEAPASRPGASGAAVPPRTRRSAG